VLNALDTFVRHFAVSRRVEKDNGGEKIIAAIRDRKCLLP